MEDYDPADLDGNGEFDAIDISIMEDEIGDGKRGVLCYFDFDWVFCWHWIMVDWS